MIHNLKIHAAPFADLVSGSKTAEVRNCADRDFKVGDHVEIFLVDESGGNATQSILREITHVQKGYGLPEDLCVLSYACIDAQRYEKLRRWMSSNVPEGWNTVEMLAALAVYVDWDAFDKALDALPVCNVGLCEVREKCCEISAEDRALLQAGDYTPEELFGVGGKPSCPKCV